MDKLLVRKDVYEELLEKGFGKKDYSKLTKKVITDKNGHRRTVFVRNGEQPAEVKQPKAQEGLSPEKKAKYEEMLEKVKAGSDENALFVGSKGMLNKKDAIAYLEKKLGKKPVSSAAQGHLESDTPQNTDITKEDEERFGKQALSGLSGKRTSSDETGYEKTSIFELQDKFNSNDGKELSGALKDEHEKVKKELEKRTAGDKPTSKGYKKGDTVFDRYGETSEVLATSDNYVYVKNSRGRKEWKSENSFAGKRPTQDDMKENYLDAKNEGGNDSDSKFGSEIENQRYKEGKEGWDKVKEELLPNIKKDVEGKLNYYRNYDPYKMIGKKTGLNAAQKKAVELNIAQNKENIAFYTGQLEGINERMASEVKSNKEDSEKPKKDTFKSKTEKYKKMGLDDRASAAIVAIAEIEDEIRKTPDSDVKKLDELDALRTDVQLNGLKSKYVKQRMEEDYNNSDEGKEKAKRKEDFESKMAKFKKWGLDNRASAASVAIDEIEEQIRNTPDNDEKKLEELAALRTDVQLNGLNSKYIREILG